MAKKGKIKGAETLERDDTLSDENGLLRMVTLGRMMLSITLNTDEESAQEIYNFCLQQKPADILKIDLQTDKSNKPELCIYLKGDIKSPETLGVIMIEYFKKIESFIKRKRAQLGVVNEGKQSIKQGCRARRVKKKQTRRAIRRTVEMGRRDAERETKKPLRLATSLITA